METFEQAIVGLLPRLRRFARALTRDMSDADDLTQIEQVIPKGAVAGERYPAPLMALLDSERDRGQN